MTRLRIDTATAKGKLSAGVLLVAGSLLAWFLANRYMHTGVPLGQVIRGLVNGGLDGLTAMGLVIIYRSIRVINFAQAALGSVAAALTVLLDNGEHWNYFASVAVGIAAAVIIGFAVDLLINWRFRESPRLIVTVVTIGLAELCGFLALELPHFFNSKLSPISTFKTPFTVSFTVKTTTFTGNDLMVMVMVPVAVVALYWFLIRTDTGVAIRGAADSSERAQLLGIPVRNLTRIAWMVAAGLSGIGSILYQPINGIALGQFAIAGSILVPLAAFVLAGMESLPLAVVWALILGVVQQAVFANYHTLVYSDVAMFALILIGYLFQRSKQVRVTGTGLGQFVAVREVAPIPRALRNLKEIRVGRVVLIAVVAGAAIAVPWITGASSVSAAVTSIVYAIIAVSMVILVGWAGQISLGQFAFAGIGSCIAGALMVHAHVPFLATIIIGGLAGAFLAALVGIPALRLEGTTLAVVTLGFAVFMSTYVLSSTYFPKLDPSTVTPPVLFDRWSLAPPYTGLYEFGLILLALTILAALGLTRSRTGRAIKAVRENSRAASAYGISPFRTKLLAFGISGFMAGVAGVMYIVHLGGISSEGFQATYSIGVFIMVVVGGLGSVTGALLGAIYYTVVATQLQGNFQYLGTGAGVLLILIINPEGLGAMLYQVRDFLVSRLASRKGLKPTGDPIDPSKAAEVGAARAAQAQARATSGKLHSAGGHSAALRLGALEDLEVMSGTPGSGASGVDAGPPSDQESVMTITEMNVGYGPSMVLFDIGFGVAESEVVALLGTNGAGKTTVLRTIAGMIRPKRGKVMFFENDVTGKHPVDRVRDGLVTVLGGRGIFPSLTVEENLRLARWTAIRHYKDSEFAKSATERVLELFPVLGERKNQRAGLLSGGEQQMLTLGQALLCRPRMLLIDELSLGLAPAVVSDLLEVIRSLAATGVTVIVVEQSVNVATAVSTRAIFMERGHVRFSGPTPNIDDQPELLRSVFLHAADRARKRKAVASGLTSGPENPVITVFAPAAPTPPPKEATIAAVLAGGLGSDEPGSSSPAATTPPGATRGMEEDVPAIAALVEGIGGESSNGQPPPAFAVVGASKSFGGVSAMTNVTLSVARGEILGIIGSNGAGKTTLLDVCSGFVKPDSGFVMMDGANVTHLSPARRASKGLGRVFQDARIWPSMTVREAFATSLERSVPVRDPLAAAMYLAEVERSEQIVDDRTEELLYELGLSRFAEQYISQLSTGIRRVVELGCALSHDPSVLLLDEPTAGIAQRESEALGELLLGLRELTGAAFIVIEHDVPLVSSLADRLVCMHLGEVIAEGETTEVLADPVVVAAYLGSDVSEARQPVGAGSATGSKGSS